MGIPEEHLHRDESIVLDLHPHWVMMLKPILAVAFTTALGVFLIVRYDDGGFVSTSLSVLAVVLILASLGWLLQKLVIWWSTNFVVTTDRCIYRAGVVRKTGIEIPLERVNTVFFEQGILDRIVGAGTLVIESAGEQGRQTFQDVKDPVMVQTVLYQEIEDNENRKFDRIGGGGGSASVADEIEKLARLRDQGHITDAEFAAQKARLLEPPDPAGS